MYTYSKLALAVPFLSLTSLSLASSPPDGYIQSCTNGQCDNCTIGNSEDSHGSEDWSINYGYPTCEIYSSYAFAGAENKGGQGYNVWWNIGKPHPECKIIVMSPVGQEVPGTNCGNVVLSTDQAGCFFTNLDHTFMVQYCCGTDNCAAALGASKRDLQDIPALMARAEAGVMDGESFAFPVTMNGSSPLDSFDLKQKRSPPSAREHLPNVPQPKDAAKSLSSRIFGRDSKPSCGPSSNEGDSYTKSGTQTQMTNTLECASDQPCNQQVSSSITVSHTVTNSRSVTWTVGGGISESIEAGFDFIIDAKSTTTFNVDFSRAVETTTGTSDETSKTSTVNQVYGQPPGTTGFVWFTPTLNCQKKTFSCTTNGQTQPMEVEQCDPALKADGSPLGELGFEATS